MIQEQRVILKLIGYGEEGSYNNIVAKDHSQGTAWWPIWATHHSQGTARWSITATHHSQGTAAASATSATHSPGAGAAPPTGGAAPAGGVQRSISLEYQICPSRHTIWYSSSGNARCDKRSNTTCDTQSYQSTVIFVFVQIFVYFVFGYFSFFCVFVCQRPMTRDQTEVLTLNLITSLPGFVKRKLQDIVNTVWRKENSWEVVERKMRITIEIVWEL